MEQKEKRGRGRPRLEKPPVRVRRSQEKDAMLSINTLKMTKNKEKIESGEGEKKTVLEQVTSTKTVNTDQPEKKEEKNTEEIVTEEVVGEIVTNPVVETVNEAQKQSLHIAELVKAQLAENKNEVEQIKSDYTKQIQELEAKLNSLTEQTLQEIKEKEVLNQELKSKIADVQALETIVKLAGVKKETVEEVAKSREQNQDGEPLKYSVGTNFLGSDKITGAAKDYVSLLEDYCPSYQWMNRITGEEIVHKDTRTADQFLRENLPSVRKDMESLAKGHGLLGSSRKTSAVAGPTTGAGSFVPDAFLDYLSGYMRINHSKRYIFWQFTQNRIDLAQGPGNTILVPRVSYLDDPTDVAEYLLGTTTSYQPVVTTDQGLVETSVPLTVNEYGLGLGNSTATRPVAIPEFISGRSMLDLEAALQKNLSHNYYGFEDLAIRSQFAATTTVYYNASNNPVTAPVLAGNGTMTKEFLNRLYSLMFGQGILTYPNGNYVLVLNPTAVAQLTESLSTFWQAPTVDQVENLTASLKATIGEADMGEKVMGYVGTHYGFDIFVVNTFGVGTNGAEGCTNVTPAGGSATLFRDSFAFGPGVVGRGVGMPVQVRQDNSATFGRLNRYIWLSHEGVGTLDCNPSINASQQLRCLRVRTCDVAI